MAAAPTPAGRPAADGPTAAADAARAEAAFAAARDLLVGHGPLRVWSVIVTIFGDLAQGRGAQGSGDQGRGAELSGACLGHLAGLMGLRPEAVRVALHRLRKDGWIESRRTGRESRYRLTPAAHAESLAAARRIYGPAPGMPATWHVRVTPPGTAPDAPPDAPHAAPLPGVALIPGPPPAPLPRGPAAPLILTGRLEGLPEWLRAANGTPAQRRAWKALLALLDGLDSLPLAGAALPADRRAVLRVLIVHRWRRVLLRDPELPDALFPPDWPAAACRARVHALLGSLPRPAPDALRHAVEPDGTTAAAPLASR